MSGAAGDRRATKGGVRPKTVEREDVKARGPELCCNSVAVNVLPA